eukprot:gene26759-33388_t
MTSANSTSYFKRHIFFCLNERKNNEACCAQHNAQAAFDRCKTRVKELGLAGPGQVRVNKAGCLDRCSGGPVAVVYPEGVWYTYVDQTDIDEIVESHLQNGQVVERLGASGVIEALRDAPAEGDVRGTAVIAHPHPLFGGSMQNKVVQTLARAFVQCGWQAIRFNFRGVGASAGRYDEGRGEAADMLALIEQVVPQGPIALAGFSFGAFVTSHVAQALGDARRPEKLVLVGTAASRFAVAPIASELHERTLVLHGEQDDTVPLSSVMDWARPQTLPITVIPGVEHFFHGQLPLLKALVMRHLSA